MFLQKVILIAIIVLLTVLVVGKLSQSYEFGFFGDVLPKGVIAEAHCGNYALRVYFPIKKEFIFKRECRWDHD